MNILGIVRDASYTCGDIGTSFSGVFPYITHLIITVIKIAIPILLVILGMLDLGKAVTASKEDEIKKSQGLFLKRLIAAILVFFVTVVVQIVIKFASSSDSSVMNCMNCFVNGEENEETACVRAE